MAESKKSNSRVLSEERARARITKNKVFELEKINKNLIIFYHSGGQWWKAIGASALIYFHFAKPRNPAVLTSKLNPDTDTFCISAEGAISVANIDKTKEALLEQGFMLRRSRDTEIMLFVAPGDKYNSKKLKEWRGEYLVKQQELNEVVTVESSDPELAAKIREFSRVAYDKIRQMDQKTQKLLGEHMLEKARELFIIYREWALGDVAKKEGLKRMINMIEQIESDLLFLMDLHSGVAIDDVAKISFKLEEIRMVIKKRLTMLKNQEGGPTN